MAITATQIESSNSLEQFRQEFNNLQSDVSGLETGTIAFSTITTTSQNTTTLNVREDGTIKFEGATDDAFETTLSVIDPTGNRLLKLPNETGTILTTAGIPSGFAIQLKNGATSAGFLEFFEDSDNGTNKVTLIGPAATADVTITLPAESGTVLTSASGGNSLITGQTSISAGAVAGGADELLLSDASASAFKRITVDNLISSAGGLTSIAGDTSPQLGGNLDTNSSNILIDDAHFIGDESGNEQLVFQTTGSAVNQFEMTNAATGLDTGEDDNSTFLNGPILQATGGDTNIDLNLLAKGNGVIAVRGNGISGSIQFNCQSNSHGQIVRGQPHSAGATNIMLLPEGADSTLVSLVSADTLTNKTLTSPKINENVAVTSTATELNALDGITAVVGELNALDLGSTAVGTAIASKAVILDSNKDYTGFRNITTTGVVTVGSQLIMPDVTSTKILVADGTSFQEVAISGDITIANTGAVTIAATSVEGSMLNNNVISGQTALTSGLATTDELLVSDGGTLKRMDVSVLTALTDASSADSAVALAIALG